jgi:hypothetical protein
VRCVRDQLDVWGLASAAPRVGRVAEGVAAAVAGGGWCRLSLDLAVLSDGSEVVRLEIYATDGNTASMLSADALDGLESESNGWNAFRHPSGVLVWAHVPTLALGPLPRTFWPAD